MVLFDATVAATVMWCTESWALKQSDKDSLHAARNQMLRKMVGRGRHPDEKWVDWMISSTRTARATAKLAGVRSWIGWHGERKGWWADHVARSSLDEWLRSVTFWRDRHWQLGNNIVSYRRPRPGRWTRWEDGVRQISEEWDVLAGERESWRKLVSDSFVE